MKTSEGNIVFHLFLFQTACHLTSLASPFLHKHLKATLYKTLLSELLLPIKSILKTSSNIHQFLCCHEDEMKNYPQHLSTFHPPSQPPLPTTKKIINLLHSLSHTFAPQFSSHIRYLTWLVPSSPFPPNRTVENIISESCKTISFVSV